MDIGQERQRGGEQEQAVHEAGRRADPPGLEAEACEQEEEKKDEDPAAYHVKSEADDDCLTPVAREEGASEEREAEARQS